MTEYYLSHKQAGMTGVETQANIMLDSYNDHLVFLSMIVTISPLLGLLGTIIGMINSFKVFDLRAGQPFDFGHGTVRGPEIPLISIGQKNHEMLHGAGASCKRR